MLWEVFVLVVFYLEGNGGLFCEIIGKVDIGVIIFFMLVFMFLWIWFFKEDFKVSNVIIWSMLNVMILLIR